MSLGQNTRFRSRNSLIDGSTIEKLLETQRLGPGNSQSFWRELEVELVLVPVLYQPTCLCLDLGLGEVGVL